MDTLTDAFLVWGDGIFLNPAQILGMDPGMLQPQSAICVGQGVGAHPLPLGSLFAWVLRSTGDKGDGCVI